MQQVSAASDQMPGGDADPREVEAFEANLLSVASEAYALARSIGRRPDEAADIVQEAALRAWRSRKTYPNDWKAWFLTITYRLCRNRRPWVTFPVFWQPVGRQADDLPFDPGLGRALRELPARQRAALWLRYAEDMSTRTVAEVLGIRESAAKQLLARGRAGLKKRLGDRLREAKQ
jgi:RNA polymerase sigma-70 factor, ECF subfamily